MTADLKLDEFLLRCVWWPIELEKRLNLSPRPNFPFLFPETADDIQTSITHFYHSLGFLKPPIIDLEQRLEQFSITILRVPLPDNISGLSKTILDQGLFIFLNQNENLLRQRFTIALELANIFLKNIHEENSSVSAESFAASILIGKDSLNTLKNIYKLNFNKISFDYILKIKQYFCISTEVLLRHLYYLDFLSESTFKMHLEQLNSYYLQNKYEEPCTFNNQIHSNISHFRKIIHISKDREQIKSRDIEKITEIFGQEIL